MMGSNSSPGRTQQLASDSQPDMHISRVKGRADSAGARDSTDSPRVALSSDRQHLVQSKSRSDLAADAQPSAAAEAKGSKAGTGRHSWLPSADWALLLWSKDARLRTTVLVNLSAILERTDEQLLPAVYNFVAAAFDASPEQLGYLTLSRALVQAAASPLGGFLGHYYSRATVICTGCLIWGTMTAGFSFCNSVHQGVFFWGVNGIGLSLVIPNGQSMIADSYPETARGSAFGILYLTGAIGAMLGTLYATNMGCAAPFGIEGWRFSFLSVAFVSVAIGVLTWMFAEDPRDARRSSSGSPALARAQTQSTRELLRETWGMCSVPTFLIIILQGILGSTPWNALVFLTLYFQLIGMSDFAASTLMALFLGGTALGGCIGGYVGDWAAVRYPSHGRILACQASVFAGVPLSLIILKGLPFSGEPLVVATYAVLLLSMGLLISWAAPACNNPVFAEIVPPHLRNMVYAFDRSFEGALAACGAPLVGILAEDVFGFKGKATTALHCSDGQSAAESLQVAENHTKAAALGNALAVSMAVPWLLCFILYSGLHWTYPRDKRKALAAAAAATHADSASTTRNNSEAVELGTVRQQPVLTLDLESEGLLKERGS